MPGCPVVAARGTWLLNKMRACWGAARLPGDVLVDGGAAIKENDDSHDGGGDEHLRVHAQPGKVQANLLPEILPAPQGRARQRQAYSPSTGRGGHTSRPSPAQTAQIGATGPLHREAQSGWGSGPGHQLWGALCFVDAHPLLPAVPREGGGGARATPEAVSSTPSPAQSRNLNELWPGGAKRSHGSNIKRLWHPMDLNKSSWAELQSPCPHRTHIASCVRPLPAPGQRPSWERTNCRRGNSYKSQGRSFFPLKAAMQGTPPSRRLGQAGL